MNEQKRQATEPTAGAPGTRREPVFSSGTNDHAGIEILLFH
jgi:hypothetical protein